MRRKKHEFFRVSIIAIFLVFSTFVFAGERGEIEDILAEAMERKSRGNPDFNDIMLEKLVNGQPKTGDVLLGKIKEINDPCNRIAAIAFSKIWDSLTKEQINSYFSTAFDVYTEFNDFYQVGDDAYIGMNYELLPYAIPKDANLVINTATIHFLNGKQHGQAFKYP